MRDFLLCPRGQAGTDAESCKFGAYGAVSRKFKRIPTEFAGVNTWMRLMVPNFQEVFTLSGSLNPPTNSYRRKTKRATPGWRRSDLFGRAVRFTRFPTATSVVGSARVDSRFLAVATALAPGSVRWRPAYSASNCRLRSRYHRRAHHRLPRPRADGQRPRPRSRQYLRRVLYRREYLLHESKAAAPCILQERAFPPAPNS